MDRTARPRGFRSWPQAPRLGAIALRWLLGSKAEVLPAGSARQQQYSLPTSPLKSLPSDRTRARLARLLRSGPAQEVRRRASRHDPDARHLHEVVVPLGFLTAHFWARSGRRESPSRWRASSTRTLESARCDERSTADRRPSSRGALTALPLWPPPGRDVGASGDRCTATRSRAVVRELSTASQPLAKRPARAPTSTHSRGERGRRPRRPCARRVWLPGARAARGRHAG